MKIYKPEIIDCGETVKIRSFFEYSEGSEYLWYEFDKKYAEYLVTEKIDGFLVALLLFAMKKGEDIYLECPVSEKLFYNLTTYYIKILSIIIPSFKQVKIFHKGLDNGSSYKTEGKAVTGFSGGVDSFCTTYKHFNDSTSDSYKLWGFIFNNVGSHGEFDSDNAYSLFNARYETLKAFPDELGMDYIKVNSNLSSILNMNFQQTHTPRNISSILLLQKLIGKYYYASSNNYSHCFVGKTFDTAYSDPVTLSLLSTETLDCISSGAENTRVEKTAIISDYEPTYRYLNVCVDDSAYGKNCSICFKCCRTLFTLELLGQIEKYKNIFDLDKYYLVRKKYIAKLLKESNNSYNKEIIDYAKSINYKFPLECRFLASILRLLPKGSISRLKFIFKK